MHLFWYKEAPTGGEDTRTNEEKEKFVRLPSFDYFFSIVKNPKSPSLINLLLLHIQAVKIDLNTLDALLYLLLDHFLAFFTSSRSIFI